MQFVVSMHCSLESLNANPLLEALLNLNRRHTVLRRHLQLFVPTVSQSSPSFREICIVCVVLFPVDIIVNIKYNATPILDFCAWFCWNQMGTAEDILHRIEPLVSNISLPSDSPPLLIDSSRGFSFASNGCAARSHVTCTCLDALQHILYFPVEFRGPELRFKWLCPRRSKIYVL